MSHRCIPLVLVLVASACGRAPKTINLTPGPTPTVDAGVSRAEVDSLWRVADRYFRHGRWGKAQPLYQRLSLELPSNDPLLVQIHFRLGESFLGQRDQLQAAREFRRVSDETPSDPLAPVALLRAGDAYGDLWRRPELDATYGSTALATYRELLSRYADSPAAARAQRRIADLEELFARKEFKAAQYYLKLKAWDSAILYLKDLVATYPRTSLAPQALLRLVHAYRVIGYSEDLKETCGYVRRFHADYPGAAEACPAPKGEGS